MHPSAANPQERPLLLLIDDDAVSREVTATLLTLSGFTVQSAAAGSEALAWLDESDGDPRLILTDAQMPGLHGCALVAELRLRTRAPIAVISGSQPEAALAQAADAVLLKPFAPEAVRQLLKTLERLPCPAARPAATQSTEHPVIRPEILAQFRSLMPEKGVLQIYDAIIADLERRAQALEAALGAGDEEMVRRIGHAVKGGCAMAGAAQAAWLGECIEEGLTSNQLGDNRQLPAQLRDAALELQRMLELEFPAASRGE